MTLSFNTIFLAILKLQGIIGPGSAIRWDKPHTNKDIPLLKAAGFLK